MRKQPPVRLGLGEVTAESLGSSAESTGAVYAFIQSHLSLCSRNCLPIAMTSLYESLTLKLANVVELATQDQGSNLTPQAKQALVRSVSIKNS